MAASQTKSLRPGKPMPNAYRNGVGVNVPKSGPSRQQQFKVKDMKMAQLDADRGYTCKASFLNPGLRVFMYKDTPGIYYDVHGVRVSEAVAKDAGFEVEVLARVRHIAERKAEFEAEIRAEYEKLTGRAKDIRASRGGFSVVALANERFNIEDADGTKINPNPLTYVEAERLFGLLAPLPQDEPEGRSDVD